MGVGDGGAQFRFVLPPGTDVGKTGPQQILACPRLAERDVLDDGFLDMLESAGRREGGFAGRMYSRRS